MKIVKNVKIKPADKGRAVERIFWAYNFYAGLMTCPYIVVRQKCWKVARRWGMKVYSEHPQWG